MSTKYTNLSWADQPWADQSWAEELHNSSMMPDGFWLPSQNEEEVSASEDDEIIDSPMIYESSKKCLRRPSFDELCLNEGKDEREDATKKSVKLLSTDSAGCLRPGRVFLPGISAASKQARRYSLEEECIFSLSSKSSKSSTETPQPTLRKTKSEESVTISTRKKSSKKKKKGSRQKKADSQKTLSASLQATNDSEGLPPAEHCQPSTQAHDDRQRVSSPFREKKEKKRCSLSFQSVKSSSSQSTLDTPPRSKSKKPLGAAPAPHRRKSEPLSPSTCSTEWSSESSVS
eukprot:scaffold1262_cov106-Cylindrotheca_fusiformis.AAC.4